MNNIGKKPVLGQNSEEAFTYDNPIAVRCISDERYKGGKEVGSLKAGEKYYAIGECRDHFVIGHPVIMMERGCHSADIKTSSTVRLECVAPKCRFEVIEE